jgi:two-component system NarL family sensor kinase
MTEGRLGTAGSDRADDDAATLEAAHADALRGLAQRAATARAERLDSLATLVTELGSQVAATQRKAVRTGYDLHDGAIQHLLVTGLELQTLRRELAALPEQHRQKPLERLSIVHARLLALENDLRDLAHSLETPGFAEVPLAESAWAEIAAFEQETAIATDVHIAGEFGQTTRSQRIAILRILQGALANVRRHSGAKRVRVELVAAADRLELLIEDDGGGFDVPEALADSARRGRLGLVSMSERVRLLGGEFDLDSRPGGPTRIAISLRAHRGVEPD